MRDWCGAFAVTAGIGIELKLAEFEAAHDDYHAIMLKSLADRLAEATAEWLHERVRKEYWGYAADEALDNEALIKERYRGIRPAPGYPSCPDHTVKAALFQLLDAPTNAGMGITESFAMTPASSVSGFYFAHPESHYFAIPKIGRDQLEDWAARTGLPLASAERWLAPLLLSPGLRPSGHPGAAAPRRPGYDGKPRSRFDRAGLPAPSGAAVVSRRTARASADPRDRRADHRRQRVFGRGDAGGRGRLAGPGVRHRRLSSLGAGEIPRGRPRPGADRIVVPARRIGAHRVGLWMGPDSAGVHGRCPLEMRIFTGIMVVGTVAGSVPILGGSRRLFGAYACLSIVPVALVFILDPSGPLEVLLGLACLLFLAGIYGAALQFRAVLMESIRLGFEKAATGGRAEPGAGSCRVGEPRQERVPRQHEPRDPHAHERHYRFQRAGDDGCRLQRGTAPISRNDSRLGGWAAQDSQRRPRHFQDRSGQAPRRVEPLRTPRVAERTMRMFALQARGKGLTLELQLAPTCPMPCAATTCASGRCSPILSATRSSSRTRRRGARSAQGR